MRTVHEDVMLMGCEEPLRTLERDEHLLLAPPHRSPMSIKLWRDHPTLSIVHFAQQYEAQPFAPPRGVYENAQIRIEWQTMDNRQPFYHRNCDVDEISYQIAGERTLMTELGVVEHRPGELSRIPRGVAHDNYGRTESHLLFYIPAPVDELIAAVRTSEATMPPFPGWKAGPVNEAITECMGTVGHDIAVFGVDEQRLLDQALQEKARLNVLRGPEVPGITWLYDSETARLGTVTLPADTDGKQYRRTVDADEIQYQISGKRTVVTQRGIAELQPGDFLRIPLGIAHTSICAERTEYLVVHSDRELPQIAETTRTANAYSPEHLAAVRTERQIQP
jgi:quercetin dioxygenase-like cupin family protein